MADTEVTEEQAQWRANVSGLISYRYLGTWSEALGEHEAKGWLNTRSDLRAPAGLKASPVGIALLDTAGINVEPAGPVAPTRIDVHLFESADGVERLEFHGRVLRAGRSQMFTESTIVDAADTDRVIGFGSTHWSVAGPNPGFNYVDSRPGAPESSDLPPLHEPFGARVRSDGELQIPELTPELGTGGLHQGPFQVVMESAAERALERAIGEAPYRIEHQGSSLIARGVGAPLVTRSEILRQDERTAVVKVELLAEGGDGRLVATSLCRFRLSEA